MYNERIFLISYGRKAAYGERETDTEEGTEEERSRIGRQGQRDVSLKDS